MINRTENWVVLSLYHQESSITYGPDSLMARSDKYSQLLSIIQRRGKGVQLGPAKSLIKKGRKRAASPEHISTISSISSGWKDFFFLYWNYFLLLFFFDNIKIIYSLLWFAFENGQVKASTMRAWIKVLQILLLKLLINFICELVISFFFTLF